MLMHPGMAQEFYVELPKLGRILIRSVRGDDDARFLKFLEHVSAEDLRLRFFGAINVHEPQFIHN
ncbi:MAG: hypothetical protein JOZ70_12705, partial [Pseudolabrys sp.]|nr:hypothetical protein [Pseudolabrys sp.]